MSFFNEQEREEMRAALDTSVDAVFGNKQMRALMRTQFVIQLLAGGAKGPSGISDDDIGHAFDVIDKVMLYAAQES